MSIGLDIEHEYCSLRDIYNRIASDFRELNLPSPQQSNFNNADLLYFSINKKFIKGKEADEIAWEDARCKDTKWAYMDFKDQYPQSHFAMEAKSRVNEIEEDEHWNLVISTNSVFSLDNYKDQYPKGRYLNEAIERIKELRKIDEDRQKKTDLQEISMWNDVIKTKDLYYIERYINAYPKGKFIIEAKRQIDSIEEEKEVQKRKKLKEENEAWDNIKSTNRLDLFEDYLRIYPEGRYVKEAENYIKSLQLPDEPPKPVNYLLIGTGCIILLTIVVLLFLYRNEKASDLKVVTSLEPSSISLLGIVDRVIPEDSIKYYKDYGELSSLKDSYNMEFDYKGGVFNNTPHGYGIAYFKNGVKYIGNFENGEKNGKGRFIFSDGYIYIGDFKDDRYYEKDKFTVAPPVIDKRQSVMEEQKVDPNKIFENVEIEASFIGGEVFWRKYLERNLNANVPVDNGAPEGTYTVYVQFVVSRDGSVRDVKALTNHGYGMEKEAVKVIQKGPSWTPAIQNGRSVNAYRKQPITFKVTSE